MTAIAERRKRVTVIGAVVAVVLLLSASAMFAVGVNTLSNSREGEVVGIDERPRVQFPVTPNALLAVQHADGGLASMAVLTLLPEGQGGSIVPVRVDADATSGFAEPRRPIVAEFDPDDVEGLVSVVEDMLSISLQRVAVVDAEVLTSLLAPIGTVNADLVTDVAVTEADGPEPTDEASDDEVELAAVPQTVTPEEAAAVLADTGSNAGITHANDVAVWDALASAAPLVTPPQAVPTDDRGHPIPPNSVAELFGRLFGGSVGVRDLALSTIAQTSGADLESVVIDRRDSALVFAQVSPALVSTPNPGLKIRVIAPFTSAQLAESGGLFASSTDLLIDFIGTMQFLQANVVSVSSDPSGALRTTEIEVIDARRLEGFGDNATMVFGDVDVRVADTVLDGIDIEVTLGMSYLEREMVRSGSRGGPAGVAPVPAPVPATVVGDG